MPRNVLLLPEGTRREDWRGLGPFHVSIGPKAAWDTRTFHMWYDATRDVLGVCHRITKTKSRIRDVSEESDVAQQARHRLAMLDEIYGTGP